MRLIAATSTGLALIDRKPGGSSTVAYVLPGRDVRCLAAAGDALYAGTQGEGVFRSRDGGHSWSPAGLEGEIVKALAAGDGAVYAGTKPAHVHVSRDDGQSWAPLAPFGRSRSWFWWSPAEKPHTAYVLAVAVSPNEPDLLLAGIEAGAVLRPPTAGGPGAGTSLAPDVTATSLRSSRVPSSTRPRAPAAHA